MKKRMLSILMAILCVISMAVPQAMPVKADQWGITSEEELIQAFNEGGSYWLENDITYSPEGETALIVSYGGMQLDLQGHTLTVDMSNAQGPAIRVDGLMELKDTQADEEENAHLQILNAGLYNYGIAVTKAGSLTMDGVSLDAGNARGAVQVIGGDIYIKNSVLTLIGDDSWNEQEPSAWDAHWAVIAMAYEKRVEDEAETGAVLPFVSLTKTKVRAEFAGILWNYGGHVTSISECDFENGLITSILNESYREIPEDRDPETAEEADAYLRQALIDSISETRIVNADEKVIVNKGRKAMVTVDSGLFRTGANNAGHDRYNNYVLSNEIDETEDPESLKKVDSRIMVRDGYFLRQDISGESQAELLSQIFSGKLNLPEGKKLSSEGQEFTGYEGDYVTYDDLYAGSYFRLVEGSSEESSQEESSQEESSTPEESSQEESSDGPSPIDDDPHYVTFAFLDESYTGSTYYDGFYVEAGSKVVRPEVDPAVTGYVFKGWFTDRELTSEFDFDTVITEDLTLYASMVRRYHITFETNGGSAIDDQYVYWTADRPVYDPTREGYDFVDWYADAELTQVYDFNQYVYNDLTIYAGWKEQQKDPEIFTVTFDTKGGSEISLVYVNEGETVSRPEAPVRDGYDFDNWYTDEELTSVYNFDAQVTGNLTLIAKWTEKAPEIYTVTFDTKGGSEISSVYVNEGETVSRPEAPVRDGYDFDNWYTDEELTNVYNFDAPVTGNLTLIAKWTEKAPEIYTVTFDTRGGSEISLVYVNEGETVNRPEAPVRDGYDFDNWYADEGITELYNFDTPVTGNLTLYAEWIRKHPETCTVTFETKGATPVEAQTVKYGEYAVRPSEDPSIEGWTFDNWYVEASMDTIFDFEKMPITQDTVIYSSWFKNKYQVAFDSCGGSEVESQTVYHDDSAAEPTAPVRKGYVLTGWFTDEELTEKYDFNTQVKKDITLYAGWKKNTYTVSFDSRKGSSVESQDVLYGETAVRPQSPSREGWTFGNWFADETLTKAYNFDTPVTGNITLYASWTEKVPAKYTVSFNTRGGNEIASQTVEENHRVAMPETPTREGWTFECWCSDELLKNTYDFNAPVTKNITLYASWTEKVPAKYTVTFNTRGGSEIASQTVVENHLAVRPEDPTREGWTFDRWFADNLLENTFSFDTPITRDITIYASWNEVVKQKYTVVFETAGGTQISNQVVTEGNSAFKPEDPAKDGFIFTGWYSNPECTDTYNFEKPVNGNLRLYAGWKQDIPEYCHVYFVTFGGSEIAPLTVKYNEKAVRPANPAKSGVSFDKWYSNEGLTEAYDFNAPVTRDITLYAGWSEGTYKVTFATGCEQKIEPQQVKPGERAVKPADLEKPGFIFGGWCTDPKTTELFNFDTPIKSNIVLYAKWTSNKGESSEESSEESKPESSIEESSREESSKTQSIPEESSVTPPTGDSMNIILWIIIGLAAAVGITALVIYMRIRNREEDDDEE